MLVGSVGVACSSPTPVHEARGGIETKAILAQHYRFHIRREPRSWCRSKATATAQPTQAGELRGGRSGGTREGASRCADHFLASRASVLRSAESTRSSQCLSTYSAGPPLMATY